MDVTDRKNTRYFKEKARQETIEPLSACVATCMLFC